MPAQSGQSVIHTWKWGATHTACGLPVTTLLKIRNGGAQRHCKRCEAVKVAWLRRAAAHSGRTMTPPGQSDSAEVRLADGRRLRATCNGKSWTVRVYLGRRTAPETAATRGSLPDAVEALGVPMSAVVDAVRASEARS
jgi:hypothetical protein